MITLEKFIENEMEFGCGYWNVCWEHACPCAITTENKGYSEQIYERMIDDARNAYELLCNEHDEYEGRICSKCGLYYHKCICSCDDDNNAAKDIYSE